MAGRLTTRLRDAFAADPRSLAAARVAIGLVLLGDLAIRAPDLRAHYTDAGVLPLEPLHEQWLSTWRFSLHGVAGSAAFEWSLFALGAAVALALLLGWRTRLVTVIAWLLTISLQNRNPLVLTGADSLLRALVLWGCFLPWGDRWSLDARRRARRGKGSSEDDANAPVTCFGTVAWTCQVILVHVMAGLLKSGDEWRKSLTAVYYTLQIDQFQLPLGALLLRLPDRALRFATAEVMLAELLVPLLLLSGLATPRLRDRLRSAAVIVLALLHLGLAATLALGLFPWVNLASLVLFLPAGFFTFWERRFSAREVRDTTVPRVEPVRSGDPELAPGWRLARLLYGSLGAALLGVVVWGNLRTLPAGKDLPWPAPLRAVVQALRLDQRWNLFAPRPMTDDGWFVVPGALQGGELVDVFRGGTPVRLAELDERSKPADVSAELGGYRWRKYLQQLRFRRNARHRSHYAAFLCREWNASHPAAQRLTALQLLYLRERTPPPGGIAKVERVPLGHFACASEGRSRGGA